VLLHSFADRKMHDFFLERDYPAITELTRVAALLTSDFQMPDLLRQRLKMEAETFDKAVEKLIAQGAASIDMAGNVRAAEDAPRQTTWRKGYDEQISFRRGQIDRMVQFAESPQCRMSALIQHFGDTADGLRPCGHCDFCAPQNTTAQTFRIPTAQEERHLRTILETLQGSTGRSTGKLHTDLALGIERKQFDAYLNALTRAGLVQIITDTFTNPEGTVINYKKASLTHEGRIFTGPLPPDLLLNEMATASSTSRKKIGNTVGPKSSKATLKVEREQTVYTAEQKILVENLRTWRKAEAAKTGKPAFMVFGDSVLHNLVLTTPKTISKLLTVSGIGQDKADRYGADIIAICRAETSVNLVRDKKEASPRPSPERSRERVERFSHFVRTAEDVTSRSIATSPTTDTFTRPRIIAPEPADSLTPEQQQLDLRLRDWRKAESERLNLPLFFVLASTTLRSIVLACPQNLTELKTIHGLGHEKIEKFGSGIIEVCTA
jgi:ATP-dependent DNA helicase RecQ